MTLTLESLDTLFPFSLIVDERWRIRCIGRSLRKIVPLLQEHQSVFDVLKLYQVSQHIASPANATDELLVFTHPTRPELRFRGQSVRLAYPENHFILSLDPTLFDTKQIGAWGLELSDFRIGDPIFDIALFTQIERRSKENLNAAKKKLEWESLAWQTILDLTIRTLNSETPLDAYRVVIDVVCTFLDWDVGNLFVTDPSNAHKLINKGTWVFRNDAQFAEFRAASEKMEPEPGVGLPGLAMQQRDVVWMQNAITNGGFIRRTTLHGITQLTGVAVPIVVAGDVIAILEFFGERPSTHKDSMIQFFRLLNIQLQQVIDRQLSAHREKAQLAALAHSSKLAAIGEIAAGVAHEINNPLHTLSLINEVLKRLGMTNVFSPQMASEQYEKIDTCIKHMSRIVTQLRNFSRDTSSHHCPIVPLTSVFQQTLDLCQARIVNRRIRLDIPSIPDTIFVRGHASELAQVLLNLINNAYDAIEHLEERWISIEVEHRSGDVEISVTDSGRGISDEIAQKIMTPFFTTKPLGQGTGLGLSISRNIITSLGGDLYIDRSCPHTRFTIRLPQVPSEAPRFDIAI